MDTTLTHFNICTNVTTFGARPHFLVVSRESVVIKTTLVSIPKRKLPVSFCYNRKHPAKFSALVVRTSYKTSRRTRSLNQAACTSMHLVFLPRCIKWPRIVFFYIICRDSIYCWHTITKWKIRMENTRSCSSLRQTLFATANDRLPPRNASRP